MRHLILPSFSQQPSLLSLKSAKGKQPESLSVAADHVSVFPLYCSQSLHLSFFLWTSKKIVFNPNAASRPSTINFGPLKLLWKILKIILKLNSQKNNCKNLVVICNQSGMKRGPFYNYCNNPKCWDRQAQCRPRSDASNYKAPDPHLHGLLLIQQYKRCSKIDFFKF